VIHYEIPDLGGYRITENKKVLSPFGQDSVKYIGKNEVEIYVFGAWRTYEIDYLYRQAFE
jgi:hypothetical protein